MTRLAATWQSRTHGGAEPAIEDLFFERDGSGWFASAMGVGMAQAKPYRLIYQMTYDRHWVLRQASIDIPDGFPEALRLRSDGAGAWINGLSDSVHDFAGCLDLIVGRSPACWAAVVRRLKLKTGDSQKQAIGFLDIPALSCRQEAVEIKALAALGEGEETGGLFQLSWPEQEPFTLAVDQNGIPLDVPMWRRLYKAEFSGAESGAASFASGPSAPGEASAENPPLGTPMG